MLPNDDFSSKNPVISSENKAPLIGLCAIVILAASKFLPSELAQKNVFLFIVAVSFAAFALPAAVFATALRKKVGFLFSAPNKGTFRLCFSAAFMLVFSALLSRCVICYINGSSHAPAGTLLSGMGYFQALFCYTLLPAVLEELIFRGVVFPVYEKSCGGLCAILASALFFAMSHLSGEDFFLYFISGLILGAVVYITRSVFACMALHLVNNFASFYLENSVFRIAAESKSGILAIFLLTALTLICLFWFLTALETVCRKRYLASSGDSFCAKRLFCDDMSPGSAFLKVFLSPVLWCAVVIFSIYLIIL